MLPMVCDIGMNRLMYRAMKEAPDHLPEVGRSSRMLGVRVSPLGDVPEDPPQFDVYPDVDGHVAPRWGMSVAMDNPRGLPRHRKPRSLGGEGRDPVFSLLVSLLGKGLNVHEDRAPHAVIEPTGRCPMTTYEAAVAATRPSWRPYHV